MNLEKILIKEAAKRFRAQAVISTIEKKIEALAEKRVMEKHKDTTFFKNNLEFQLEGVTARIRTNGPTNTDVQTVYLNLVFFCKSKLPKQKRQLVEKTKEDYKKNPDCFHYWNRLKTPLWYSTDFSPSLKSILSNEFSLDIKNMDS